MKVLSSINEPKDLKSLRYEELELLAGEIRELIIKKVGTVGGHMGSNLGIVELTMALHFVFDSPKDKIVFDVSHQCYTHKILTGRKDAFIEPEKYDEASGFSNPDESEHDFFKIGHTSTSISLACGLAKARDLNGDKENIIAVIGDGSLSGGQAYEGLNNAAVLGSNIIIVVNDNEMSIAENSGGLYQNLAILRKTQGKAECNFFKTLGFDYRYVENGNNLKDLIAAFESVKNISNPIVLHVHTQKGKGLKQAEKEKEKWHWVLPNPFSDLNTNQNINETYESITSQYIEKKYEKDKSVIAVSAATPGATGLTPPFRAKAGKHYIDVGIAEEHAVAFISGLAKNGAKPIFEVLSSFVQRVYDQLLQDLALNSSPATIIVFDTGINNSNVTHLGCFDISMISNIPNIVYLAPTCKEEYLAMLDWSVEQNQHPVVIRVPSGKLRCTLKTYDNDYSKLNKFKVEKQGKDVAIIALGSFFELGERVLRYLELTCGISATLINPRYITGIDCELLNDLKSMHRVVVTLEDGVLDGGFGEKIARFYGNCDMKVLNFGADKVFTDRVPTEELYNRYRLKEDLIVEDIMKNL